MSKGVSEGRASQKLRQTLEGCEFCENGEITESYEEFKQFSGKDCYIDLYMDRDKITNEYSLVVDHAVSCVINYCPMCGRKLEV